MRPGSAQPACTPKPTSRCWGKTGKRPSQMAMNLHPELSDSVPPIGACRYESTRNCSAEINFQHAARQAYIGLSAALIAAAFEVVDSTPMEGFDPKALDEILSLPARGLRSVAIPPLGYRQEEGD